jgi:hypothetical protein
MAEKLNIPDAPSVLPPGLQAKWKDTYAKAHAEAVNDFPDDTIQQRQTALREANRMIRAPKLESFEDAKKLAKYLVHASEEKDGVLKLVTIDGKKYKFPVPTNAVAAGNQNGNGGGGQQSTTA